MLLVTNTTLQSHIVMASRIPQFDPKRIYQNFKEEIDRAINNVLISGNYIAGEEVEQFEKNLASYISPEDDHIVISCANGTDALELAFRAAGLKAGDEVMMPSHNFVSGVEMAATLGLIPVWIDCKHQGFTIESSAEELLKHLTPKTKALVAVNMYGIPADWKQLKEFCTKHKLILIEDNAQGLGGKYIDCGKEHMLGVQGDISTMSFFPTKPLGCMGDGGAVSCHKDSPYAIPLRRLAKHGQLEKYHFVEYGRNSRLDAIQAAILNVKLPHLEETVQMQRNIAKSYTDAFAIIDNKHITLPVKNLDTDKYRPAWHLYTILVKNGQRDKLRAFLKERAIDAGLYYPTPMHKVECYSNISSGSSSACIRTNEISKEILSLPIFPFMTEEEVARVVAGVMEFFYK